MKIKYPRTPHLPWSEGSTSDDVKLSSVRHFVGKNVVVTEKMDGENTTLYNDHIHARSLDSKDHESRHWAKAFWSGIKDGIPSEYRICGENVFAEHSIRYSALESYFYGFSVWDEKNFCLSWLETQVWFGLLGITSVPVIYRGMFDATMVKNCMMDGAEGYVVRLDEGFDYSDFDTSVAKFVRKGHVQTDSHWMHSKIVPNGLK